ncbi:hypothetical protein PsasTeo6_21976 [Pseudomonas asiatica]|nr:hypothetical protein PsasTeo6_21976 [Pseudomonas asiatica]
MKIITPCFVPPDNFDVDTFQRRDFSSALTNVVTSTNEPLVISLNGSWGVGKTTFIKMWQGELRKENTHSIYIDAFSNDHSDNAFLVVASAIIDYARVHHAPQTGELMEKAKTVGTQLMSIGAKIALRAATLGVLKETDIEALEGVKDSISESLSDFAGSIIEEKLKSFNKDRLAIESFKAYLSALPEGLAKEEAPRPLVVVIDELDRCRPSFAVEVLEKIKHLFSVENVIFVLVINKLQMEESIRSTYGSNIDAHTYLQKFISLEATLPRRKDRNSNDLKVYSELLSRLHEFPEDLRIDLEEGAEKIGNHFDLTLRQLERSYSNIAVFYTATGTHQNYHPSVVVLISVLKVVNPELFNKVGSHGIHYQAFEGEIGRIHEDNYPLHIATQWLRLGLMKDHEFNNLAKDDEARHLGHRPHQRQSIIHRHFAPLMFFSPQ